MTVAYKKSECFDDTEKIIEKIIEKSSLQYIIETSKEKIEGNLNKGTFGLGKIHFSRKRKQISFVCLVRRSRTQNF